MNDTMKEVTLRELDTEIRKLTEAERVIFTDACNKLIVVFDNHPDLLKAMLKKSLIDAGLETMIKT